jgi:ssDNA-binding replication factor A large subunit
MQGNYDKILDKISRSAGVEKSEIERRIEAKREKLSGLISREGAAQIIASELGISFDNEKLKINELLPSMRKVNVIGQIINMMPIRTFRTKKGEESKVTNIWIADDTSNIKVVLWDTNHIALIEKGEIKDGSVVEISNGSMRDSELHLGSFSELKLSNEVFGELRTEKIIREKNIFDFKKGENTGVRAFIVQIFEPRFFNVCSQCSKKVTPEGDGFVCGEHGKVAPEKRALVNIVLDDGTESIRAVLFHENLSHLGLTELENTEKLTSQKQGLLGKEMFFEGNVRNNAFFNTPEFIVEGVREIDLDELVNKLEKD